MAEPLDRDLLTLWTRRFAVLIHSGVSLLRTLTVLAEDETNGPLAAVSQGLAEHVQGGETLSTAMRRFPEVFDHVYVGFVQAGEIGGILEVTLDLLAAALADGTDRWPELPPDQLSRVELLHWCRLFGRLLEAGVPLALTLDFLAGFHREPLRGATQAVQLAVAGGSTLQEAMAPYQRLFSPTVTAAAGLQPPRYLPATLERCAEQIGYEAGLEREGKLAPLQR